MIFDAEDFSEFEGCARYPQLKRNFDPPRWPIRLAAKEFFKSGIRQIMSGHSIDEFLRWWVDQAASPGFEYPGDAEAYTCAKDYEAWLEGALRLIQEECGQGEPLELFKIENHHLHVESWTGNDNSVHLFRIKANLGDKKIMWPELCLAALQEKAIYIHVFRLPSTRNGRLLSPLNMAYQHPVIRNTRYRLNKFGDGDEFSNRWKKIGRWEIQPVMGWEEWRRGIDRDKALPLIREVYQVSLNLDSHQKDSLRYDIGQFMNAMEKPSIYPRFREKCSDCVFDNLCHGTREQRREYNSLKITLDK